MRRVFTLLIGENARNRDMIFINFELRNNPDYQFALSCFVLRNFFKCYP